ncbi:phosphatase PAP2 family protein [Secundilactobacillus kimchicus]|uniref:phosphatase PAP2 family protein n=1 Tax=Secundilactobacillus kimchicus TaxID=528209 RepID=UPI0024A8467B|nr:phosphatase PAP2 family protein [Secundilactobacillus kimchicus]
MKQTSKYRLSVFGLSWLAVAVWTTIVVSRFQPLRHLDHQFLRILRANGRPGLTTFFNVVTAMADPTTVMILGLTITIALWLMRKNPLALKTIVFIVLGNLVVHGVKVLVARPRPLQQMVPATGFSFPSGHTFNAVLIAILFWEIIAIVLQHQSTRVIVAALLIVWVGLVGLSRMYLQVHFPSDIIGGLLFGWAWFETTELMFELLHIPSRFGTHRF